jgi:acyl carrier protein
MLSALENVPSKEAASVETRVLGLIVETCGLLHGELSPSTTLSEALDSLTLVAVITRIEAAFDIVLSSDEMSELLGARDVAELGRLIARKVEGSRAKLVEDTRNGSC